MVEIDDRKFKILQAVVRNYLGRTIVINANPRIRKLLQIAGLQDQVCIMDEI